MVFSRVPILLGYYHRIMDRNWDASHSGPLSGLDVCLQKTIFNARVELSLYSQSTKSMTSAMGTHSSNQIPYLFACFKSNMCHDDTTFYPLSVVGSVATKVTL